MQPLCVYCAVDFLRGLFTACAREATCIDAHATLSIDLTTRKILNHAKEESIIYHISKQEQIEPALSDSQGQAKIPHNRGKRGITYA